MQRRVRALTFAGRTVFRTRDNRTDIDATVAYDAAGGAIAWVRHDLETAANGLP